MNHDINSPNWTVHCAIHSVMWGITYSRRRKQKSVETGDQAGGNGSSNSG
jgi:hypothetical protein